MPTAELSSVFPADIGPPSASSVTGVNDIYRLRFGVDDRDFGQNSGFVMSRMVDARFNQHRWSTYSQIAMLTNIRYGIPN
jgi:hypothetical protein